ncbi:uncharacterized protein PHALS_14659 [Plasmopara halstedii]|uniref:Uncharacterized protein n=1 Tax=Plasmopara halstedii TaxID=4781 RepID=A0A0P1AN69_PLAHL|nr:uncharacterized protein PHALS_14659 [Plasmopara halstedii]CEG42814.1 hypothetical protein PHALS_14659 [Plasmopara halstedii]|eukprot:XP_024579183.1 hypothetical protein PHALS_14659 [Plasmopara halstedii]
MLTGPWPLRLQRFDDQRDFIASTRGSILRRLQSVVSSTNDNKGVDKAAPECMIIHVRGYNRKEQIYVFIESTSYVFTTCGTLPRSVRLTLLSLSRQSSVRLTLLSLSRQSSLSCRCMSTVKRRKVRTAI